MTWKGAVFALALVAVSLFALPAAAAEPCAGCRLSLPEGEGPVPLLVALHGDHQPIAELHEAWKQKTVKRGIALLSLACPRALGCNGSYWRWDGEPDWVSEQIAKVSAARAVDRDRLWLVGWSGGASYIGWRTQAFERTFAAIVIHGGGMAPASSACVEPKVPLYFLVGDKNPLHHLAGQLREHYVACGSDVTWDLVRGAEHPAEWAALSSHGKAIVDWLVAHPRGPAKATPP